MCTWECACHPPCGCRTHGGGRGDAYAITLPAMHTLTPRRPPHPQPSPSSHRSPLTSYPHPQPSPLTPHSHPSPLTPHPHPYPHPSFTHTLTLTHLQPSALTSHLSHPSHPSPSHPPRLLWTTRECECQGTSAPSYVGSSGRRTLTYIASRRPACTVAITSPTPVGGGAGGAGGGGEDGDEGDG